jgi:hypothetical protein
MDPGFCLYTVTSRRGEHAWEDNISVYIYEVLVSGSNKKCFSYPEVQGHEDDCRSEDLKLHTFLTLPFYREKWLDSRFGRLTAGKSRWYAFDIGSWVGCRAGLTVVEKRKILASVQTLAGHFTDWAIPCSVMVILSNFTDFCCWGKEDVAVKQKQDGGLFQYTATGLTNKLKFYNRKLYISLWSCGSSCVGSATELPLQAWIYLSIFLCWVILWRHTPCNEQIICPRSPTKLVNHSKIFLK